MVSCGKHVFEEATGRCRRCEADFCADCLVYAFGPRKAPFCVSCALEVSGIRSRTPRRLSFPIGQ
jgi:hypothetical protein